MNFSIQASPRAGCCTFGEAISSPPFGDLPPLSHPEGKLSQSQRLHSVPTPTASLEPNDAEFFGIVAGFQHSYRFPRGEPRRGRSSPILEIYGRPSHARRASTFTPWRPDSLTRTANASFPLQPKLAPQRALGCFCHVYGSLRLGSQARKGTGDVSRIVLLSEL